MYKPTNPSKRSNDLNKMKSSRSTSTLLAAIVAIALLPMSLSANAQDAEPPVIEPLPSIGAACGLRLPDPDPSIVNAYDAVSGNDVYVKWETDRYGDVDCDWGNGGLGEIQVVWRWYSATDFSGNIAYVRQEFFVADSTPPIVDAIPDLEVECGTDIPEPGRLGRWSWDIFLMQNCNYEYFTHEWVSDTQFGTGCGSTIEREYVVRDTCGNETFVIQTIRISRGKGGGGFPKGGKGGGKKK